MSLREAKENKWKCYSGIINLLKFHDLFFDVGVRTISSLVFLITSKFVL